MLCFNCTLLFTLGGLTGVMVASSAFAYLFLWTARPASWPPDGSTLPGFSAPALVVILVAIGCCVFLVAQRQNRRDRRDVAAGSLVAAALVGAVACWVAWAWPANRSGDVRQPMCVIALASSRSAPLANGPCDLFEQ
jgi:uncharacterized BrkB/YihY/UPF0761 family membrane protein